MIGVVTEDAIENDRCDGVCKGSSSGVEFLMNRNSGDIMLLIRNKDNTQCTEVVISHEEMLSTMASALILMRDSGFSTEYELEDGTQVRLGMEFVRPKGEGA